jgi:AcrR family transcriptional regulator
MAHARDIPATVKDPEIVAQRRAELIEVATSLFLRNGFHKTSVREIVRACNFNVASLYMYVASKEDILFLVAQQLMTEKSAELARARNKNMSALDAFKTAFRTYCELIRRNRRNVKLLYREMDNLPLDRQKVVLESETAVHSLFREIVETGIEKGEMRPTNTALLAQTAVFMAHRWSLTYWSLKDVVSFEDFVEGHLQMLLQVLLPAPAKNPA